MNRIPVTVLILTLNEELAIGNCLNSVKDFDQVVVIDSGSLDKTCEIALQFGATVVNFEWDGLYPKKKQWSLNLSIIRNEWVLFLDADEIVQSDLIDEIRGLFNSSRSMGHTAYEIKLNYEFMGKQLNHGHRVKKISLLKKDFCSFPELDDLSVSNMWEVEGHYQPLVSGSIGHLKGNIYHRDPDSLFDYFSRHNRYSDWEASIATSKFLSSQINSLRSAQGRKFQNIPLKPITFFMYSYICKFGWRDGREGLDYAIALSFYYWQINVKKRELLLTSSNKKIS